MKKERQSLANKRQLSPQQDDVASRGHFAVDVTTATALQQRQRERLSSAASQRSAPPAEPCSTGSLTNFSGLPAHSRRRQLPQEAMGFLRPPPACLTSEHHQTGPTLVARELWCRSPTERHGKAGGRLPALPSDGCPPLARTEGPDPEPGCSGRLQHLLLCRPWQRKPSASQHPCVGTSSPGDGHESQVAGHTGKLQTTREAGTRGDERAAPESTAGQNELQQRLEQ